MAVDIFHFVHQHYGIAVAFLLGVITSFVRSFVRSFQSAGQGQGRAGHLGATEAAGAIDRSIASIFIKWGRKGSLNNYEARRVESSRVDRPQIPLLILIHKKKREEEEEEEEAKVFWLASTRVGG